MVVGNVITTETFEEDRLMQIARQYWAPYAASNRPFDPNLIDTIYENELVRNLFMQKKIIVLEFSQYLERYLWPNFNAERANNHYVMSVVIMLNAKFRERIPVWRCILERSAQFPVFFRRILRLVLDVKQVTLLERSEIITFLINCFNSVASYALKLQEVDLVRKEVMKIVSLTMWSNLLPTQREDLFQVNPKLRKIWNKFETKAESSTAEEKELLTFERTFMWNLLEIFKQTLADVDDESNEVGIDGIHFLERCLQLFIDLEALLTTRRFFNAILHASNILVNCTLSSLITAEVGELFCQLVTMLKFYSRFEIDDVTGEPLTHSQMAEMHYTHVMKLQKAAFKYFRESMSDFYLLNVTAVDTRKALVKQFSSMSESELYKFAEYLHLVPSQEFNSDVLSSYEKNYLIEMITSRCERRINQLQQLNEQPLYPTEKVIWDENLVPYDQYNGEGVLALNKLNIQFLTFHDYLLRNFNLFQMESTYEIRQDIEDTIFRLKPWAHESNPNETVWGGWARMALPLVEFQIVEVGKPLIGEKSPAVVKADLTINLPRRTDIRSEWEGLRKHDVCFLICCRPKASVGTKYNIRKPFKEQIDVTLVRGCEIEGMLDSEGKVIEEYAAYEKKTVLEGLTRKFRVWLDENQYRLDTEGQEDAIDNIYYSFNLLIRRDPKTNNFKAVLATIRQLLNTEFVVPDWLHDLILGYGEPNAAHYKSMNIAVPTVDFCDTFLSYKHLISSFPNTKIVGTATNDEDLVPPFRLTFKELEPQHDIEPCIRDTSIVVEPHVIPCRGPYPHVEPRKNTIQFTPAQVEAIKAGMQPGLTMVVGPPGTGKTDVAVQIISNIYHNWPEQRTLIVTHSNQALNQLFEKIMQLDVDERHLLRLGHGEEALETEKDFSRYGRVNYVLQKRLDLLKEVEKLQEALDVGGDVSYTCETAGYFFLYQVFARWEKFESDVAQSRTNPNPSAQAIADHFPFTRYFADVPPPLFKGVSFEEDWEIAQGCWRYIRGIFTQLEEFRSFELLRSGRDRTDYLLVKEAKIIAMTCTHAALRRKDLVELGFRYDNILMEEAAQILEVETFIPLLLQNPQDGRSRLKRWIMIGDHHQLPPVVQNIAFQKYSNMEQSLFARFVRLGVPHILLDQQGRARAEIADLYNWRYEQLGNLPHIEALPEFQRANSGFVFNYQLIDVPDFNGVGETTPSPYFYQNLGEAEYAVALFTYMRILGYPAEKISIITTYNGQASLLRDVVQTRCAENPLIGVPHKISTVDKYQGQQNDYIILSLVRTKNIGHIRDVRRLVVALSRARLGLYVLGRVSLFQNCLELATAFQRLCKYPQKLMIIPHETYLMCRKNGHPPDSEPIQIHDTVHMSTFVHQFYMSNMEQMKESYKEHMKEYFDARQAAINAHLEAEAAAKAAEEAKTEEEKGIPEPTAMEAEEADITFESMDFERQDPEKLGK
uniref:Intron-binding protein aquarius n=1 Tax=Elaeophora elaphi TaxID=1147741 RepID=A0A0R3RQH9_9BILA